MTEFSGGLVEHIKIDFIDQKYFYIRFSQFFFYQFSNDNYSYEKHTKIQALSIT